MHTYLTVIRHGETEWNKSGKQQGWLDSPLTDTGVRQAEAVRDALQGPVDSILSSDLGRARLTAEIIAARFTLPVTLEPNLRERNLGIMRGLTMEEFRERHPAEYSRFYRGDPDYVIPEGESAAGRFRRAVAAFEKMVREYAGKRLVVVTHGGILESLFRYVLGLPVAGHRTFSLINGSLNTFTASAADKTLIWRLESWGEIGHLQGLSALDDF